jgi:hypothetical protein
MLHDVSHAAFGDGEIDVRVGVEEDAFAYGYSACIWSGQSSDAVEQRGLP